MNTGIYRGQFGGSGPHLKSLVKDEAISVAESGREDFFRNTTGGFLQFFENLIPEREARLMPGLNRCISQSSPAGGVRLSCYGR